MVMFTDAEAILKSNQHSVKISFFLFIFFRSCKQGWILLLTCRGVEFFFFLPVTYNVRS